ncbi:MAG: 3'(2'),5'-bisphosphate nucleotidase [Planctomycetota bacterium]|nr:3'(2'),5'-bisphosphate nucleotidase [Planctomycetota bacterium]
MNRDSLNRTHPWLEAALATVAGACRVARRVQHDRGGLERIKKITKDDRSPVTVADFAVQAVIAMELLAKDEKTLIVGEEKAGALREPEQAPVLEAVIDAARIVREDASVGDVLEAIDRCDHDGTGGGYWALDPIDGTKGFLRGQQYAIALGRIENGRVVLGVIGCPNLPLDQDRPLDEADEAGVIYAAVAGAGAWEFADADPRAEPRPVRAASFDGERPVRVCESVEAEHSNQSQSAQIIEALGSTNAPVRLDSQCKYAVVARGQADAYLRLPRRADYVEKIWDHAAGSVIASEAGAVITDITGAPLDFTHGRKLQANRGVVCTAAGLHDRIIAAIRELGIDAPA